MQDDLVDHLVHRGAVRSPRVAAVMRMVDRKQFVGDRVDAAYEDHPQPIGQGQTISAPHMHAACLELLQHQLAVGARALDVGSGSGYLTACMALLVGPQGFVLGIEKFPELAKKSVGNICRSNPELKLSTTTAAEPAGQAAGPVLTSGTNVGSGLNWRIVHGNALSDVLAPEQPFDAIHVGAAAEEIPRQLLDVLKPGGRMVIPVGERWETQALTVVDKHLDGNLSAQRMMAVSYVPLTCPTEMEDDVDPVRFMASKVDDGGL